MSEHPQPRRAYSTQLLVDLVMDPRDPGYESAARRNGGVPARHWYDKPAVVLGALVLGFVLAVAYVHTNRGAPQAAQIHDDLVDRVRTAQQAADDLATKATDLAGQLNRVRDASLSAGLTQQLDREQLAAGQLAVHGPGLVVRLAEPAAPTPTAGPGRASPNPGSAGHILTDRDVRSVVNELWHDGAEAIAVNDIRLTPTSAIRFAGDAVLVDFQPISSPYVVDAIGDSDGLAVAFADSGVASRYQTLSSAKGLGFRFDGSADLQLPAAAGTVLRYATAGTAR
jgi:uncharacterized protein YlxW (UPF0749 family)